MSLHMKHIFLLALLLLVTSCMKEIDLEHLRPEPKLVLNCVIIQDKPIIASLSRTWFYTEGGVNLLMENADVKLYVNDRFVEQLSFNLNAYNYNTFGGYVATYIPVVGDKIRIEAEMDGYKPVVAEDVIPGPPTLLNFAVENYYNQNPYYSYFQERLKVTFRDDPSAGNCYLIRFTRGYPEYDYVGDDWEKTKVYKGSYKWYSQYVDFASEPIFANKITILDKVMGNDWLSGGQGRPFSDELFNGKEYTMKLDNGYSYSSESSEPIMPDSMRVYLYAISESYYKYMLALASLNDGSLNNDLADIGLAEPVRVFNNIEGGVGILGTACVDSLTVAIPNKVLPDND